MEVIVLDFLALHVWLPSNLQSCTLCMSPLMGASCAFLLGRKKTGCRRGKRISRPRSWEKHRENLMKKTYDARYLLLFLLFLMPLKFLLFLMFLTFLLFLMLLQFLLFQMLLRPLPFILGKHHCQLTKVRKGPATLQQMSQISHQQSHHRTCQRKWWVGTSCNRPFQRRGFSSRLRRR